MDTIYSYLMSFRNVTHRKDFELDIWRLQNFIKVSTNLTQTGNKFGKTCKLLRDLQTEIEC